MARAATNSGSEFSKRVHEFIERVNYRRMESAAELDTIRRLRYDAYLREGAIGPNDEERLVDEFDDLGKVANIGVYHEEKLIGGLRLHFLESPEDPSPAHDAFADILTPLLQAGKRFVDPNRFVADFTSARNFPELPFATLRLSMMASAHHNADFITATVRAEHRAFYRRVFFATQICPPRKYPMLLKDLGLMFVDHGNERARILARNPYFASTPEECAALFGPTIEKAETPAGGFQKSAA